MLLSFLFLPQFFFFSFLKSVPQGLCRVLSCPSRVPRRCSALPPSSPQIATRKAYGQALAKLGHASDRIIALDGDTKNSTFSDLFRKEHPERFIECYIAEQNMVGAGAGRWAQGQPRPWGRGLRGAGVGLEPFCPFGRLRWLCQAPPRYPGRPQNS